MAEVKAQLASEDYGKVDLRGDFSAISLRFFVSLIVCTHSASSRYNNFFLLPVLLITDCVTLTVDFFVRDGIKIPSGL